LSDSARLVFAGTPEFAAAHLQALVDAGQRPLAVYTQPDRPAGRGQKLNPSPVKALARAHGIPVEQPESLKTPEAQQTLRTYAPDLLIVVAYGLLLPPAVLAIPRLDCVNVHASLLPRWRGAAPIQRALLAGDAETGVALMQMEAGLDTGPVLALSRLQITPEDTGGRLHDRLAAAGSALLVQELPALLAGRLKPVPQPEQGITYAHKLDKAEATIDWGRSAAAIERQVRAFNPWPVAQTSVNGQTLRIWRASALAEHGGAEPGQILASNPGALRIACGEGVLAVQEVQLAGGKRLAVRELLNARQALFAAGSRLGGP
jgi:methionyl-tRNA formyltransferase